MFKQLKKRGSILTGHNRNYNEKRREYLLKQRQYIIQQQYSIQQQQMLQQRQIQQKEIQINQQKYKKTIGIINYYSYPGGGGEEFLYDFCNYAKSKNINIVWFYKSKWINTYSISDRDINFLQVDIENEKELKDKLLNFNLDGIFHSGRGHYNAVSICNNINIPIITIWCFWEEILKINSNFGIEDIIKNIDKHEKNENFLNIINNSSNYYFASNFIREVVELKYNIKINEKHILPTITNNNRAKKDSNIYSFNSKYITIVNCHNKKGGLIFADIIKNNPDKHYIAIDSEPDNLFTSKRIKLMMDNCNHNDNHLIKRTNNIKHIYNKTRIIICPTQLDETFCRVVFEGFQNKIPVIFSNKGNLKYLENQGFLIVNEQNYVNYEKYIKMLEDKNFYDKILKIQENYINKNFNLIGCFDNIIREIYPETIGIFTPWCDQGLGIQSRVYREILENNKKNVAIFSSAPYRKKNEKNKDRICKKSEWKIKNIYKSHNDRFNVLLNEFDIFINKFNVKKLIIPEINNNAFQIAKYVKDKFNIEVIGIPNIECIFNKEIPYCKVFDKILLNNKSTYDYFKKFNLQNIFYLGFSYEKSKLVKFPENKITYINNNNKIVKFLHLTGLNGFTRKRTIEILEVFSNIFNLGYKNFILTIVVQGNFIDFSQKAVSLEKYKNSSCINIINKHMSYADIIKLYNENHVSIQISKHEGLGLGFYESCYLNTPVLSLDVPPHNEIIHNEKNGWLVKSWLERDNVRDCTDTVKQSQFKLNDLKNCIINIITNIENTNKIILQTKEYLNKIHNIDSFTKKFIKFLE